MARLSSGNLPASVEWERHLPPTLQLDAVIPVNAGGFQDGWKLSRLVRHIQLLKIR